MHIQQCYTILFWLTDWMARIFINKGWGNQSSEDSTENGICEITNIDISSTDIFMLARCQDFCTVSGVKLALSKHESSHPKIDD